MSRVKFIVRLKHVHDKTGLTPYAVAKKISAAENTVRKYIESDEVVGHTMYGAVIELCDFYGVDWHDPSIVEVVIEEDSEEEIKTALIA